MGVSCYSIIYIFLQRSRLLVVYNDNNNKKWLFMLNDVDDGRHKEIEVTTTTGLSVIQHKIVVDESFSLKAGK